MKILLIEDEVKLAEYLRKGLGEVGYVVDVAHTGVDGLHMALEGGQYLPDGGTHSGVVQITYRVDKDPEARSGEEPRY